MMHAMFVCAGDREHEASVAAGLIHANVDNGDPSPAERAARPAKHACLFPSIGCVLGLCHPFFLLLDEAYIRQKLPFDVEVRSVIFVLRPRP